MNSENRELTMDELNVVAGGFGAQEHGSLGPSVTYGRPPLRGTANRFTHAR